MFRQSTNQITTQVLSSDVTGRHKQPVDSDIAGRNSG